MTEDYEFIPTLADLFHLDPRFEKYIRVEGACWIWTGYINWSGAKKTIPYGRIRRLGAGKSATAVYVHRYVWELFWSTFPAGFESHHSCENTLCCNPSHATPINPREHHRLHNHVENLGFYAVEKWLRQHINRLP